MNSLNLQDLQKLYFKLSEEQNPRKVAESLDRFLPTPDEAGKYAKTLQLNSSDKYVHRFNIKILNLFDPEVQLINTKPMIKNKLKEFLRKLEKFKVQTMLVWEYRKRNDCKIFHYSTKVFASDSDIEEAFKSIHQSIMIRIKNSASNDWIDTETILKHYYGIWTCINKLRKC